MAENEEELKSLLMRVKEESEKELKTQHSKSKIMASGPITSQQIEGEKVEAVTDFLFLGSKITTDGGQSHDFRKCLLFRYLVPGFGPAAGERVREEPSQGLLGRVAWRGGDLRLGVSQALA